MVNVWSVCVSVCVCEWGWLVCGVCVCLCVCVSGDGWCNLIQSDASVKAEAAVQIKTAYN